MTIPFTPIQIPPLESLPQADEAVYSPSTPDSKEDDE